MWSTNVGRVKKIIAVFTQSVNKHHIEFITDT